MYENGSTEEEVTDIINLGNKLTDVLKCVGPWKGE